MKKYKKDFSKALERVKYEKLKMPTHIQINKKINKIESAVSDTKDI